MNCFLLSNSGFAGKVDFTMFTVIAILSTVLMVFVGYKLLQILQLTGYKIKGYFMWFKETKYSYMSRLFMLSFLNIASMLMTNVLLADFFIDKIFSYVSIIFYILFCSLFITNLFSAKQKTPLKYTKRISRLLVVFIVLVAVLTWGIQYVGFRFIPYLSFGLIGIIPILLPIVVLLAYYITWPIEKIISNSYLKKAKKKLKKNENLTVIGITGSYGKTSVKNILGTILSEKFKVCVTPASYNTPLGLSKTILSKLKPDDEIFLAEMGAKQRNDIMELCNMVSPKIGIITGIGNQHLLTFGSEENIVKTKGELAEFITKNNGKIYICTDNEKTKQLIKNYPNAIESSMSKKEGLFACDVKNTTEGLEFDLCFKKEKVHCKTILLGEHNVSNILLASKVALDLGLSLDEIANGISKLKTIPHRLEILKTQSPYTIIDNAYNSSVEGSSASLNVLSCFEGSKFVITPGLVELGSEQFNSNFEFGKNMAKVADYVLIDSPINYDAISSGLVFGGFDEKKIIQVANLNLAVEMLSKLAKQGDVVLFENDLPDNYS